ncbi:MAG: peptide-methionine (R)-S-oxide reductase MsrB [Parcubacteria group bacterium]|nr:peptide-methionine (R)-S-oxide reductase MsrB [Parcubacteria group bacterium]
MNNKYIKNEEALKKRLTSEEYAVLRDKGTEASFSGVYAKTNEAGMYACKVCGNKLFSSDAKFDSGTGWPSFDSALPGAVEYITDDSHGMHRTEVVCATCGSHLGHVFDDGHTPRGKRYCINSVCLEHKKHADLTQRTISINWRVTFFLRTRKCPDVFILCLFPKAYQKALLVWRRCPCL